MATTTTAKRDAWINRAVGRKINPDKTFGFQCKDVNDDYGMSLYGTKLGVAVPLGNAGVVFDRLSATYWKKIRNDPKQPNQLPQKGDMIFWAPAAWNLWYGHCAVVDSADINGVNVIQQDGILQTAAHRKRWTWKHLPQGWARPNYQAAPAPAKPALKAAKGIVTVTYPGGVNVRESYSTKSAVVASYTKGQKFRYDGYIDANGYRWLSYVAIASKKRRYVAQRTLDGKTKFVSGGVN